MAVIISKPHKGPARSGVLAAGNWIVDEVKLVDVYPSVEKLANIRSQSLGTGGAPYNVLVDLAKLGATFPLAAAGLVGARERPRACDHPALLAGWSRRLPAAAGQRRGRRQR